ncbi:hypothetical protein P692DRAFT_20762436 [Suillus brevipes Sb2]|nr:hypothetical protein P692DRAFT_20762436 [Suillus brevipes Sb2]
MDQILDSCTEDNTRDANHATSASASNSRQHRVTSRKHRRLRQHPYTVLKDSICRKVTLDDRRCPRNGRTLPAPQMWQEQATSIRSHSFITSDALIAALAAPRVGSVASSLDVQTWVASSLAYLKVPESVELGGGSVEEMVARCRLLSVQATGSSLVAIITYMQLAIQCQSIMGASTAAESRGIRKIYNEKIKKLQDAPSERTFQRWYEHGCKFIILAAGGSFYLLVMIAGLEIRWKITTMRFQVLRQVANMLRQPATISESSFAFLFLY